MPVNSIKKQPVRVQAVDPQTIPGYQAPPDLSSPGNPRMRQFSPQQIIEGATPLPATQAQQTAATPTPKPFIPLPTYRWVSRFFEAGTVKDGSGQHDIGYWLTNLEETTDRVVGVQAAYVPGGVIVLAKVQESISDD